MLGLVGRPRNTTTIRPASTSSPTDRETVPLPAPTTAEMCSNVHLMCPRSSGHADRKNNSVFSVQAVRVPLNHGFGLFGVPTSPFGTLNHPWRGLVARLGRG